MSEKALRINKAHEVGRVRKDVMDTVTIRKGRVEMGRNKGKRHLRCKGQNSTCTGVRV